MKLFKNSEELREKSEAGNLHVFRPFFGQNFRQLSRDQILTSVLFVFTPN